MRHKYASSIGRRREVSAKIVLWQAAFLTIFVFARPSYFPDLPWQAYAVLYAVLLGLWAVAIRDLKSRWDAFMERHSL